MRTVSQPFSINSPLSRLTLKGLPAIFILWTLSSKTITSGMVALLQVKHTVRTMSAVRSKRLLSAALVLVGLGVLVASLLLVEGTLRPRFAGPNASVAEADAALHAAERREVLVRQMRDRSIAVIQRVGLSNSPPAQAVDSLGRTLVEKANMETVFARADVDFARKRVAADQSIGKCEDSFSAERMLAKLRLSGFEGGVLRPLSAQLQGGAQPSAYAVMVPHEIAVQASIALQWAEASTFSFGPDLPRWLRAREFLKDNGIMAIPLVRSEGNGKTREFFHCVRRADEERAKNVLLISNVERF